MDRKEEPDYRLLFLGWFVAILFVICFTCDAGGEECGKAYYQQFAGRGKEARTWMLLNDQVYLEVYKGYTFSVRSESQYLPCRMSQTPMVFKENSLVIKRDGEVIHQFFWRGGYIVAIAYGTDKFGKVFLHTKEYLHECYRYEPTTELDKMLKSVIVYHRWREK